MNTTPHGNCENTDGLSAEGLIIQTFYWRLNLMAHNLPYLKSPKSLNIVYLQHWIVSPPKSVESEQTPDSSDKDNRAG